MVSTFHGLETVRRGMSTQQSALYTTGHNIANANTPGYTRQRVNFTQTNPYPAAGMNTPKIPGQMGTGVEAGTVQRIRESFLDVQFRGEQTKSSYWESRATALEKMEEIMNEPTTAGLANTMNKFWESLQDLAGNPEDLGARAVVRQRGQAVADTFSYLSSSLKEIQEDLGSQISNDIKTINSLSEQISKINKQISEIEPVGYLPNDLYDERDRLIDELSKYVDIKVHPARNSGGNSLPVAEGILDISIIGPNGESQFLIEGSKFSRLSVTPADDSDLDGINDQPTGAVEGLALVDESGNSTSLNFIPSGEMKGLIESYGYKETSDGPVKGIYPEMLDSLDKMAYSFITKFNEVHSEGYTLKIKDDPNNPSERGGAFFTPLDTYKDAASLISLSDAIKDKETGLNKIAASSLIDQDGNGIHATKLADVKNYKFTGTDGTNGYPFASGSIQSFYESLIGTMGVDAQEAERMANNSVVLLDSVDNRRQSVSAVSLDEEMTNMIKFQQAYNGSARMITVMDEMLDKIINGLGVGGR
ncbi:flagellar hook-associated protein FlgK [Fredinandcohnia humi]